MNFPRSSGILLHPTSLPGAHGIGELGGEAHRFADFLKDAGQRIWQVLPLGPTGYGDSPYQCFSAFAGNPLLINLDTLVKRGYLSADDLAQQPEIAARQRRFWDPDCGGSFRCCAKRQKRFPANSADGATKRLTRRFASAIRRGWTSLRFSWLSKRSTTTSCGRCGNPNSRCVSLRRSIRPGATFTSRSRPTSSFSLSSSASGRT